MGAAFACAAACHFSWSNFGRYGIQVRSFFRPNPNQHKPYLPGTEKEVPRRERKNFRRMYLPCGNRSVMSHTHTSKRGIETSVDRAPRPTKRHFHQTQEILTGHRNKLWNRPETLGNFAAPNPGPSSHTLDHAQAIGRTDTNTLRPPRAIRLVELRSTHLCFFPLPQITMSIARTLPALAIVVAVLLATVALAAPSNLQVASALTKRADCPAPFFFAGGVDLPYVFDAGQSPIAANGDWRECAMVAQQAGKMGAIYRYDTKTCYFKNFPRNGAVTYDYDGRAFANFDIYGFDVNSNGYSSYDAARSVYPTVVVKNAGKWWAKKLPKCDQCVMILVSDIRC